MIKSFKRKKVVSQNILYYLYFLYLLYLYFFLIQIFGIVLAITFTINITSIIITITIVICCSILQQILL